MAGEDAASGGSSEHAARQEAGRVRAPDPERRALLEAALGAVPDAITVLGRDGTFAFVNRAALALIATGADAPAPGEGAADVLARFELLRPDGTPLPEDELPTRRALAGELDEDLQEVRYRVRATGEERLSLLHTVAVRDAGGEPLYAVAVFRDVTEPRRGEERLRLLAEAGTLLGSSLDEEATLRSLSELVVPRLADWYAVDMRGQGGLRRVERVHADPAKVELLHELERLLEGPGLAARVAETGRSYLLQVDAEAVERFFGSQPEVAAGLRRLGLRSSIVVPLVSRARTLGTLTLATAESGRVYGPADLELAEELGRRAGAAVDNARLHREVERTAALLDTLFGTAPVGLAFLDRDQRFVRVNEALARINGLTPEEHVGRRLDDIVPTADPTVHARFAQVLESGRPLLDQEEVGETPVEPGVRRYWRVSYYPISADTGDVLGVGVVLVDETPQKRVEAERAELLAREQAARAEAEQAARMLRRLARITEAALEHLSLTDLLNALLARLVEVLEADTAVILLRTEEDTLEVRATVGLGEALRQAVPIPIGGGMAGRVAAERRSRLITDLDEVELASPHLRIRGVHSLVAVPLVVEGSAIGVFHVGSVEPSRFGEADLHLLELVADRIALAIQQASLYEAESRARAEAQEAQRRLEFLAEASGILGSSLDYEETLANLAELLVPSLADVCAVHVLEPDGRIGTVALVHVDPARGRALQERSRVPLDPAAEVGVPAVVRTGRAQFLPEVTEEIVERLAADRPGREEELRELVGSSGLAVPLSARGRTFGALTLVATVSGRRFDERDLVFAEELARRAATAVDNALLYRQAEERARAARILENVGDGVFLVDGDGVVRYWNGVASAITGLAAGEVVDRRADEAIPGWPAVAAVAARGGQAESLPLQLPDRELWLSLSCVPLEEGTVFAFRDLTEERAIEQLRAEFVSTVSHELRTPLAAIYGAAMTLLRDDVALGEEQRRDLLGIVTGESDRLARIVNDILWTSRLDAQTLHVARERCDPVELASGVVSAHRAHLPPAVTLELAAAEGLPAVLADPDKARQVLVNLVDNAVKYSPDGGRVSVTVVLRGAHVRFAVADEGLGIPYAEQRRIFDKFYRLDPDLTRGVGGTGLGLYISRELVRRMGGRIWVESEPGRGSTFTVELPIAGPEASAHPR